MAKCLLEKETIDITDIIHLIGERPYKLPDSIKDYLKEIEERKAHKLKMEQERLEKEKEDKEKEENDADDNKGKEEPEEPKIKVKEGKAKA